MEADGLFCTRCGIRYDQGNHIPRIFPFCGHTFCTECFREFLYECPDNRIQCPIDKTIHYIPNKIITVFPINYMLKSLVELKGSKWTSCHDHNKEIEFICISDRLRICGECAIMGLHQGHEIKLIDQLYIEINEKTKLLETKLDQVKTHHKDLSGMLELEKETMLISLRSKFEILDRILKMKEEELVHDINIFFEKEKITLDEALGEESSFKRKIEENLHILKNGSSEVNMIEVIEDQSFETEVNLEDQNFEKCYVRSNEKLKEISKSLNSFIDLQIQATQQLTFPLKNFSLIAF